MRTPRIVFKLPNRRGLGHFVRGLNIAMAAKAIASEAHILFWTRVRPPPDMAPDWLDVANEDVLGRMGARSAVKAFDPDAVVFDTLPPAEEDLDLLPRARRVLIMRRSQERRHHALLEDPGVASMDLFIVPHDRDEFGHVIPDWMEARARFVGTISRRPDPALTRLVERKYSLEPGARLLISTGGGGGFADSADAFREFVMLVHELLQSRRSMRHLFILGPLHPGGPSVTPGPEVVSSEPHLVELFSLATAVIAEGGYNTVAEIGVAETPAFFVPGRRSIDDQFERVRRAEKRGQAIVVADRGMADAKRVVDALCDDGALRRMRRSYRAAPVRLGNERAASEIIEVTKS